MSAGIEIAGGSVTGRDHVLLGRNNQDAFCWSSTAEATVAVVADGCGSGRHSEIGSGLGARLLVEALRGRAAAFDAGDPAEPLERVRLDVLAQLRVLANAMGGSLSQVVSDYFLFTALGFVATAETCTVFGIGDGLVGVNGRVQLLRAANDAPPYLAYALTGSTFADDAVRFAVHDRRPASELSSVLVATDGAAELSAGPAAGALADFWVADRYFTNPYSVQRRLHQLNRTVTRPNWDERRLETRPGQLPDDTTVIVARRAGR